MSYRRLTPQEIKAIVKALQTGKLSQIQIAEKWDTSQANVSKIAIKHGIAPGRGRSALTRKKKDKLPPLSVLEQAVFQDLGRGMRQVDIAEKHGISQSRVSAINRKSLSNDSFFMRRFTRVLRRKRRR